MITNPINAVDMVIEGIKKSSRMFNEPTPPKPDNDALAKELAECIDIAANLTYEMRRLENRLVLVQSKLAGLEVGK